MGAKTGNPRGRPKGVKNRRTKAVEAATAVAAVKIAEAIPGAFEGDAHSLLMAVYKDPLKDWNVRVDAAKAAIRYEKPALSSVTAELDANVKATVTAIERRIVRPNPINPNS